MKCPLHQKKRKRVVASIQFPTLSLGCFPELRLLLSMFRGTHLCDVILSLSIGATSDMTSPSRWVASSRLLQISSSAGLPSPTPLHNAPPAGDQTDRTAPPLVDTRQQDVEFDRFHPDGCHDDRSDAPPGRRPGRRSTRKWPFLLQLQLRLRSGPCQNGSALWRSI